MPSKHTVVSFSKYSYTGANHPFSNLIESWLKTITHTLTLGYRARKIQSYSEIYMFCVQKNETTESKQQYDLLLLFFFIWKI